MYTLNHPTLLSCKNSWDTLSMCEKIVKYTHVNVLKVEMFAKIFTTIVCVCSIDF